MYSSTLKINKFDEKNIFSHPPVLAEVILHMCFIKRMIVSTPLAFQGACSGTTMKTEIKRCLFSGPMTPRKRKITK